MSRRRRILVALGIAVVAGGVYAWLFGIQTACAVMARYSYRKLPDAAKIPVPLSDLSISNTPHRKVFYFGYELELPWDDVDDQKSKTVGTIHLNYSRSGNAFWFSTFPPKEFVNAIMETAKLDPQGFRQLYGEEAFESDYSFHRKMLQMTPSAITPFISPRQAISGQMLLMIKTISMPKASSGIFSIQSPGFEGYQFENPETRPLRITDELFSAEGGIEVIFFQKVDGNAPTISQAEINRVIQSIHKVPQRTGVSNANNQR